MPIQHSGQISKSAHAKKSSVPDKIDRIRRPQKLAKTGSKKGGNAPDRRGRTRGSGSEEDGAVGAEEEPAGVAVGSEAGPDILGSIANRSTAYRNFAQAADLQVGSEMESAGDGT